jgi:hypothetical protein
MLSGGDQLFIGFEKVSATAHCRQVRQLLEKLSSCLGRSTTTDKAKDPAKARVYLYPEPTLGPFFAMKVQSS